MWPDPGESTATLESDSLPTPSESESEAVSSSVSVKLELDSEWVSSSVSGGISVRGNQSMPFDYIKSFIQKHFNDQEDIED